MNKLRAWIKNAFCKHAETSFVRNIYGDEINRVSLSKVYRSWWKCLGCGKHIPKERLVSKEDQEEMLWRKENFNKSVNPPTTVK